MLLWGFFSDFPITLGGKKKEDHFDQDDALLNYMGFRLSGNDLDTTDLLLLVFFQFSFWSLSYLKGYRTIELDNVSE